MTFSSPDVLWADIKYAQGANQGANKDARQVTRHIGGQRPAPDGGQRQRLLHAKCNRHQRTGDGTGHEHRDQAWVFQPELIVREMYEEEIAAVRERHDAMIVEFGIDEPA